MKRGFFFILLAFAAALTAACNSGGSSNVPNGGGNPNPPPVTPTPFTSPSPSITPTPVGTPANTALSFYMPLATGNTWTFQSGGKMVDRGSITLACNNCPGQGTSMDQVELLSPSGTSGGFLFFTKQPSNGHLLTTLIGSQPPGQSLIVLSDTLFPKGFPIMDDTPSLNEQWTDGTASSTITAVGFTMTLLPSLAPVINNATDALSDSTAGEIITWSFAQGVGITYLSQSGASTWLSSFSIDTTNSHTMRIRSISGTAGRPDFASVLRTLFY